MPWVVIAGIVVALLWLFARGASDIWRRKGRSPGVGMLLGLAGPLGLLAAWLTPSIDRRGKHPCINCHRWIPDRTIRCPHCHHGFKAPVATTRRYSQSSL
jgi:hypothetical protein